MLFEERFLLFVFLGSCRKHIKYSLESRQLMQKNTAGSGRLRKSSATPAALTRVDLLVLVRVLVLVSATQIGGKLLKRLCEGQPGDGFQILIGCMIHVCFLPGSARSGGTMPSDISQCLTRMGERAWLEIACQPTSNFEPCSQKSKPPGGG